MIIHHLKGIWNRAPKAITTLSLMALSSLATGLTTGFLMEDSCQIGKPAYIFFKDRKYKQGILQSISSQFVWIQENKETPSSQQNIHKNYRYSLNTIQKIVFFPDEEAFRQDQNPDSKSLYLGGFTGRYQLLAGGHKGILVIYTTPSGFIGGYVRFPQWGKGKIEYLKYIQVQGNTITFVRSCSGKECLEIGAPYEFKQIYKGTLNSRNHLIGKYSGTHSSGQWKAIRLP